MATNRLFHGHRLGVRGSALRRLHVTAWINRSAIFVLFLFGSALFSVRAIDSNHDGMSDIWQRLYGVADGSGSEDPDGDGFTNLQESLLGTDPDDASSAIHLQLFPQPGNSLRLTIETVVGKLYQIESSQDLVHWTALGDPIAGTGDAVEVEAPESAAIVFYRGRFAGDIDNDGDGLTAWEEIQLQTSDSNPDTDGDGMPDGWEVAHGLDPLTDDAGNDPDEDGLSNLEEYQRGSDPNDFFNGQTPQLTIVSGDNQTSAPATFVSAPMVVRALDALGAPLVGAPIRFGVSATAGGLAIDPDADVYSLLIVKTDNDGLAQAWFQQPNRAGAVSAIIASAVSGADSPGLTLHASTPGGLIVEPSIVSTIVNAGQTTAVNVTLTNDTTDVKEFAATTTNDTIAEPGFIDSDQPTGPAFTWNDISSTGTRLAGISDANDQFESFDISFDFPYFDQTFRKIYVSSNGFITFGAGSSESGHGRLPDPLMPAYEIAAFHNDLNLGLSGDVYYQDDGDKVTIQFSNAARMGGDGLATFQIVLQRDGSIFFYYFALSGTTDQATVGLQNGTGDQGLTIAFDQPYLKKGLAIQIRTPVRWLTVVPASGTIGPGESVSLQVQLDGTFLRNGSLAGAVQIASNPADENNPVLAVQMTVNEGPEVALTSPLDGTPSVEGLDLSLHATAADNDGIGKVEFYDNGAKVGEATAPPFSVTWQGVSFGNHTITARATDRLGAIRMSPPAVIDAQADSNHNGMGDAWEMKHFGNLDQTAGDDFDGDGLSNSAEFAANTDPTNGDTDGDGVSDGAEINIYHSNARALDSDGDGMDDNYEVAHGLDPMSNDANLDSDNDGLTNVEEMALGTDPQNADSDGDSVTDGLDGWPLQKQISTPRLPAVRYAILDLGIGTPTALNNRGDVVGATDDVPEEENSGQEAVLWRPGQPPKLLGFLSNDTTIDRQSDATGINDDEVITGWATFSWDPYVSEDFPNPPTYPYLNNGSSSGHDNAHAFRWSTEVMHDLNDLSFDQRGDTNFPDGSNKAFSAANGINASGLIVGAAEGGVSVQNVGWAWWIVADFLHAVQFTPSGSPLDLNVTAGDIQAQAEAINDDGAIVGFGANNGQSAFFLKNGVLKLIGKGNGATFANSLNNLEHVVGALGSTGQALLWVNREDLSAIDRYVDLQAIAESKGFSQISVGAINDHDQILGAGRTPFSDPDYGPLLWQNGKVYRLQDLIPSDSGWTLVSANAINQKGCIAATAARQDDSELQAVLLVPFELMVDKNRDEKMSFDEATIHDQDQTSKGDPYRFWVNDDQDALPSSSDSAEVVPVHPAPDDSDDHIQSTRDCEDLTRLWVNLRGITNAFANGDVRVFFKFRNTEGTNPGIRIFRSVTGFNGTLAYITDHASAVAQLTPPYDESLRNIVFTTSVASSTDEVYLNPGWWDGINEDNPVICLLFEGVTEGKGELYCEFFQNDQKIGESPGVWLDIKNVKKMFQRFDISGGTRPQWAATPFEPPADESKQTIVFVHGWNMSPEGAENYAETMFKRCWWRGFKGRFAAVRWNTHWSSAFDNVPKVGEVLGAYLAKYDESEHVAWMSGSALKDVFRSLPGDYDTNLIAHSMGNVVCASALRAGLEIDNYALLHAAVPASCYDEAESLKQQPKWAFYNGFLPVHLWFGATPDEDDDLVTRSMAYRGQLRNVHGNLVNFFLPADHATQYAWELNNALKPDSTFAYLPTPIRAAGSASLRES